MVGLTGTLGFQTLHISSNSSRGSSDNPSSLDSYPAISSFETIFDMTSNSPYKKRQQSPAMGARTGKDAIMESKLMDIIADYQAVLQALWAKKGNNKLGPLAAQQKLWDTDAILSHCRSQSIHLDLRRAQNLHLRRWIESASGVMKSLKLQEKKGDRQMNRGDDEEDDDDDNDDEDEIGSEEDDDDGEEDDRIDGSSSDENASSVPLMVVKDTNLLNRSLRNFYNPHANQEPVIEDPPTATDQQQQEQTNSVAEPPSVNGTSNTASNTSSAPPLDPESTEARIAAAEQRIANARASNNSKKRLKRGSDSTGGSDPKKPKTTPLELTAAKYQPPTARLADLGGIDNVVEEVLQLIGMPLKHPEIYLHLGIQPPRGILLHGPPGCGKTMLANAIAGEAGVPFITISAPSIVSGMSGESEKKIREVFEEAKQLAPCLLFIDEIDAITPKRETAQREMERRIVAQLLTCLDDISFEKTDNKPVLVIGATNRPDSLDPALRRAGRFDREISMGVPDEAARVKILSKMCEKLKLQGDFDFVKLAKLTPGYVGADLSALTSEAGVIAVKRIFQELSQGNINLDGSAVAQKGVEGGVTGETADMDVDEDTTKASSSTAEQESTITPATLNAASTVISSFLNARTTSLDSNELQPLCITEEDFLSAIPKVQPSSKREGFATVPDVSWTDVGALSNIREELRMSVVEPIRHPEHFARVGITKPMGVLLYGPPGCGKTLLAKAVANESCCNFISVKGPELLNKFVGESERGVRQVFARAAASKPCVIFFDELDALCPSRSTDSENQSTSRLVNTLLTELDGMQGRSQVYIIAATNRPDLIDAAMLRPGRLDKTLYVDLPTPLERAEILKTLTKKTPLRADVDLHAIGTSDNCDGFSGADLAALVREAAVAALRESFLYRPGGLVHSDGVVVGETSKRRVSEEVDEAGKVWVTPEHFAIAFTKMAPSVSKRDRKKYELLKVKFSSGMMSAPPVANGGNEGQGGTEQKAEAK
ncbi:hypothetical protein HDV05_005668 [Chytridiales sp. JEL 0842]|nr:hypothetical protein HDV05_005668 [Chytridiales sp. JEL 0842]